MQVAIIIINHLKQYLIIYKCFLINLQGGLYAYLS